MDGYKKRKRKEKKRKNYQVSPMSQEITAFGKFIEECIFRKNLHTQRIVHTNAKDAKAVTNNILFYTFNINTELPSNVTNNIPIFLQLNNFV